MQTTVVRAMVSQTVGWASVFCALPGGGGEARVQPGLGQGSTLLGWRASLSTPPGLTHKAELVGEHLEEAVAVHGEEDGKVGGQAAPDEEVVDGRPETRVQPDLVERGRRRQGSEDGHGAQGTAPGQNGTQTFTRVCYRLGLSSRVPTCTLTTITREVATVTAKDW